MRTFNANPRPMLRRHRRVGCLCFLWMLLLATAPVTAVADSSSNGITGPVGAVFRAGMWWDPTRSGSGWDLSRVGEQLFGVWYTYGANGRPVWFTFSGSVRDGHFEGDLLSFTWDYGTGTLQAPSVAGSVSIDFPHPQLAEVEWQLGDRSGHRSLQPFLFAAVPTLADYSGVWFERPRPGYGLSVQTQGNVVFSVIYFYGADGKPTWASGQALRSSPDMELLSGQGACSWCAYSPTEYKATGRLALRFRDETLARVDVTLDAGDPSWNRRNVRQVMLSEPPSGRPHAAALATLSSDEALKVYFKAGFDAGHGHLGETICLAPVEGPVPAEGDADTPELSTTNVQEQGVDEADMVKALSGQMFAIDYASAELPWDEETGTRNQSISRYTLATDGSPPVADGLYPVSLAGGDSPFGYFLREGIYRHDTQAGLHTLVHLATQFAGGCFEPSRQTTWITDFDVGPGADFEADHELVVDGELLASRRIGDRLFVAIAWRPDVYELVDRVLGPDALADPDLQRRIDEAFEQIEAGELLPAIRYSDGREIPLVDPQRIMLPPLPLDRVYPVLTTLSVFDLDDLSAPPDSLGIMGSVDGMYASTQAVYFASSRYGVTLSDAGELVPTGLVDTDIHKLAIGEGGVEYRGSGTVEGVVGFDPERLPWRMGEHGGDLRILTSHGWTQRWGELGEHRLTILRESGDDDLLLRTVSVLPHAGRPQPIGKPGEDIHAVRFHGDRAWVVTFQRVDPLYVLDLSDPEDPALLGELEIEGFSDYLHPVGDDLLIGVGLQAVTNGMGTWMQGLQLGLFDVSVPTDPVLLDLHEIGHRGSWSPVLDTHRAFTWLPASDEDDRPPRFVLPAIVHSPPDGMPHMDPAHWYPWEATGIMMYNIAGLEVNAPFLELAGQSYLADRDSTPEEHHWYYANPDRDQSRSVIYGGQVIYYFRGGVYQTPWTGGDLTPAEHCAHCQPPDG